MERVSAERCVRDWCQVNQHKTNTTSCRNFHRKKPWDTRFIDYHLNVYTRWLEHWIKFNTTLKKSNFNSRQKHSRQKCRNTRLILKAYSIGPSLSDCPTWRTTGLLYCVVISSDVTCIHINDLLRNAPEIMSENLKHAVTLYLHSILESWQKNNSRKTIMAFPESS